MLASKNYSWIGRVLSPPVLIVLRIYAKIARVERARIAVLDTKGRLLLVRSWVGTQLWELPGGAIQRNERPLDAALRETFEETSLRLSPQSCTSLGYYRGTHLFSVAVSDTIASNMNISWEITECQWSKPKNIPQNIDPFVAWALQVVSN